MSLVYGYVFKEHIHSKLDSKKIKVTGKSEILYLDTNQYLLITKHSVLAYEETSISEISIVTVY